MNEGKVHFLPSDRAAFQILEDFYNSTNGSGWIIKTNWLSSTISYCDWYGITCFGSSFKIAIRSNRLIGTIPSSLGQLTQLQWLDLSSNQLSGTIPLSLGQLIKLQQLYLSLNQLSGTIPSSLGQLTQIQSVYISNNQLSGTIPSSLGQLTQLGELDLSNNQLSD